MEKVRLPNQEAGERHTTPSFFTIVSALPASLSGCVARVPEPPSSPCLPSWGKDASHPPAHCAARLCDRGEKFKCKIFTSTAPTYLELGPPYVILELKQSAVQGELKKNVFPCIQLSPIAFRAYVRDLKPSCQAQRGSCFSSNRTEKIIQLVHQVLCCQSSENSRASEFISMLPATKQSGANVLVLWRILVTLLRSNTIRQNDRKRSSFAALRH